MRKIVSCLLIIVMGASLLVGCGSTKNDTTAGDDTAVNKDTEVNQEEEVDEEEEETEEYVDPYLDVAVDGETLMGYVTEIEVSADNWQEYFYVSEKTDEEGGEHAGKVLNLYVNDGYYIDETVVFTLNYNEKTNYTTTLPEYGPSTNVFDEYKEAQEVSVKSYGNGIISSTYIYDESDDGVTTELITEITDITCSNVSGKIYSMQIPEDSWQTDEDGAQVIYLKQEMDDGTEFTVSYENTPEDLRELWDVLRSDYM